VKLASLSILLALASCDSPTRAAIRNCEARIQARLKAPSTYRRISVETIGADFVDIDFDAQNPMGVPLRHHATCVNSVDNGEPVIRGPEDDVTL